MLGFPHEWSYMILLPSRRGDWEYISFLLSAALQAYRISLFYPEERGTTFLRYVNDVVPDYTASHRKPVMFKDYLTWEH
jgi:hypothetical protein